MKTHHIFMQGSLLLLTAVLTSCGGGGNDSIPPAVSLISPANNAPVYGTVQVQVSATDDTRVAKVSVYARTPGSTAAGVLIGSATEKPYVISWVTTSVPNSSDLELYAVATDSSGNVGKSDAVKVHTNNPGEPVLSYLAGYNLPSDTRTASSSLKVARLVPSLGAAHIDAPGGLKASAVRPQFLTTLEPNRYLALEWGWPTYASADGYGIFLGSDLVGPYMRQRSQASATAGLQKFSRKLTLDEAGTPLFGTVTAISQNLSVESGYSNAQTARFLRTQQSASPVDGQVVQDGRPVLTWVTNPDADAYLYYVFDGYPLDATSNIVWTNAPRSTTALSAAYPSDQTALKSGSYYWWVAGVAFDSNNQANTFSFSTPLKFTVP